MLLLKSETNQKRTLIQGNWHLESTFVLNEQLYLPSRLVTVRSCKNGYFLCSLCVHQWYGVCAFNFWFNQSHNLTQYLEPFFCLAVSLISFMYSVPCFWYCAVPALPRIRFPEQWGVPPQTMMIAVHLRCEVLLHIGWGNYADNETTLLATLCEGDTKPVHQKSNST